MKPGLEEEITIIAKKKFYKKRNGLEQLWNMVFQNNGGGGSREAHDSDTMDSFLFFPR